MLLSHTELAPLPSDQALDNCLQSSMDVVKGLVASFKKNTREALKDKGIKMKADAHERPYGFRVFVSFYEDTEDTEDTEVAREDSGLINQAVCRVVDKNPRRLEYLSAFFENQDDLVKRFQRLPPIQKEDASFHIRTTDTISDSCES